MTDQEFQDLLNKLGSEETSRDEFNKILEKIRGDICSMPEVRVFVDSALNFGHQSSTIALMRQFIDWTGYRNNITIFFKTEPGTLRTQNKLALLLPCIDAETLATNPGQVCLSYGTCSHITFSMIDNAAVLPEPADFVPFGFTGGSDSGQDFHKLLKVRFFLCLQPYMWCHLNRIEVFPKDGGEVQVINLENRVGKHMKKALYLYNEATLTAPSPELWDWYTTKIRLYDMAGSSITYNDTRTQAFHRRIRNAKLIFQAITENKALVWPIYGLQNYRYHCEPLSEYFDVSYDITGHILFNLVLCGLFYQLNFPPEACPPIVMPLFNTITQDPETADEFDLIEGELFGYIKAFIAGADDFSDYVASHNCYAELSRQDKRGYVMKPSDSPEACVALADALELRREFLEKSSQTLIPIHILERLEEGMSLENGHIYILKTGPLPMDLFNYFFWNAGMPPFFEGQGTSSLAILTGRPFLQCSLSDYRSYPSAVFSFQDADPYGKQVYNKVMPLVKRFFTWTTAGSFSLFIKTLSLFIKNSYHQGTEEYNYFYNLRKIYSSPCCSKLFLGIINMYFTYKNFLFGEGNPLSLPVDAGSMIRTLKDVYAALVSAVQGGEDPFCLLSALKGTRFAEYFYYVSQGYFPASIDLNNIERNYDSKGALCQVSAKQGTVSLFSRDFSFSLTFSCPEFTHALVSVFSCVSSETWRLPGVPWVCLENFGFETRIFEGDLPVEGWLTGTLKGTDLNLTIPYPPQGKTLVVRGEFPDPVSVLDPFYQAAGGINFIQSMPEALQAVGGFGLKSLSFVYSLAHESCLSMDFCLTTDKPWTILETPCLSITPELKVTIAAPGDLQKRSISFQAGGQFFIGKGVVGVTASYPDFQIHARLVQDEIDLNSFVEMFGGTIDLKSSISAFQLDILPGEHTFFLDGGIRADWNLFDLFTLRTLCFHVRKDPWNIGLFLSGQMVLLPDTLKMQLYVQGSYNTASKGWQILARQSLDGNGQISGFLSHYLGWDAGQYDLPVANMEFMTDCASQSWRISAEVQEKLPIPFLNNVSLETQFSFGKEKNAQGQIETHAMLSADFRWNNIDLLLWYSYEPEIQSFGFTWNRLKAVISKNPASQWTGTICFAEEVTLGSIIETLVSWARGSRFGLEAPWNALDKIPPVRTGA